MHNFRLLEPLAPAPLVRERTVVDDVDVILVDTNEDKSSFVNSKLSLKIFSKPSSLVIIFALNDV
jgi:hypothetical protein